MKFHRRSGTVGFISDSQFKFLVEDDEMQAFIFQQNYEKHVLFHRGGTSCEVVKNSKEALVNWSKSGVDKVIACFGTVDILNMEYESHDVSRVVGEISRGVSELKKICDRLEIKLVYVTPGVIGTISEGVLTSIVHKVALFVKSLGVDMVFTPSIMISNGGEMV